MKTRCDARRGAGSSLHPKIAGIHTRAVEPEPRTCGGTESSESAVVLVGVAVVTVPLAGLMSGPSAAVQVPWWRHLSVLPHRRPAAPPAQPIHARVPHQQLTHSKQLTPRKQRCSRLSWPPSINGELNHMQ